jgi:Rrf2 family iron-sulfur cluster assembly transcriptional regulator
MRITTWAEYGVICALHLARRADEGPVTGRDIAARERLPGDYVEQILLRLRRAAITVREIITAAELVTFDLHCETHPLDSERCAQSCDCSIRPVWMMLQRRIDEVLEGVLLSDLLHAEPQVRERVGLERAGLPVLQA